VFIGLQANDIIVIDSGKHLSIVKNWPMQRLFQFHSHPIQGWTA
jgi:hypothetical protein